MAGEKPRAKPAAEGEVEKVDGPPKEGEKGGAAVDKVTAAGAALSKPEEARVAAKPGADTAKLHSVAIETGGAAQPSLEARAKTLGTELKPGPTADSASANLRNTGPSDLKFDASTGQLVSATIDGIDGKYVLQQIRHKLKITAPAGDSILLDGQAKLEIEGGALRVDVGQAEQVKRYTSEFPGTGFGSSVELLDRLQALGMTKASVPWSASRIGVRPPFESWEHFGERIGAKVIGEAGASAGSVNMQLESGAVANFDAASGKIQSATLQGRDGEYVIKQSDGKLSITGPGQAERILAGPGSLAVNDGKLAATVHDADTRDPTFRDEFVKSRADAFLNRLMGLREEGVFHEQLSGGGQVDFRRDPSNATITEASFSGDGGKYVLRQNGAEVSVTRPDGTERVLSGVGHMRVVGGTFELSMTTNGELNGLRFNNSGSGEGSAYVFANKLDRYPEAGVTTLVLRNGGSAAVRTDPNSKEITEVKINQPDGYKLNQSGDRIELTLPDGSRKTLPGTGKITLGPGALELELNEDSKVVRRGLGLANSDRYGSESRLLELLAPEYTKPKAYENLRSWLIGGAESDQVDFRGESREEREARFQRNADLAAELPTVLKGGSDEAPLKGDPEHVLSWLRDFSQQKAALTLPYEQTQQIAEQLKYWAQDNGYDVDYHKREPLSALENNPKAVLETALRTSIRTLSASGLTFQSVIPRSSDLADVREAYLNGMPPEDRLKALKEDLPSAISGGKEKIVSWLRDYARSGYKPEEHDAKEIADQLEHYARENKVFLFSDTGETLVKELEELPGGQLGRIFPGLFSNSAATEAAGGRSGEFNPPGAFKPAVPRAEQAAPAEPGAALAQMIGQAMGDPVVMRRLEKEVPGLAAKLDELKGLSPKKLALLERAARSRLGSGAGAAALLLFAATAGLEAMKHRAR